MPLRQASVGCSTFLSVIPCSSCSTEVSFRPPNSLVGSSYDMFGEHCPFANTCIHRSCSFIIIIIIELGPAVDYTSPKSTSGTDVLRINFMYNKARDNSL